MVFGPSPSGPSLGHGSLPSGSLVRLRELGREQRARVYVNLTNVPLSCSTSQPRAITRFRPALYSAGVAFSRNRKGAFFSM